MNHSFNIEVATKHGIEKAIILENLYWWITKNKANKKNFKDGKYWTYNTSEAFAELFPYLTSRRIAELLRQMEKEKLILSHQKKGYDRTKSYALSDIALSYFESSIIHNLDNGTYTNLTIESQEDVSSLNTDINTNVNTDVNQIYEEKPKKIKREKKIFIPPTLEQIQEYCKERNNTISAKDFFDFYEATEWCTNGKKISSWKGKVITWEMNQKNFSVNKQEKTRKGFDVEKERAANDSEVW